MQTLTILKHRTSKNNKSKLCQKKKETCSKLQKKMFLNIF